MPLARRLENGTNWFSIQNLGNDTHGLPLLKHTALAGTHDRASSRALDAIHFWVHTSRKIYGI